MRLVTWNCCRGDRAAKLAALSPDVAILQEVGRPAPPLPDRTHAWFGDKPRQGVAVVTANGFEVEAMPSTPGASAYAARVFGPLPFHLLAVWARRSPSYARAVLDALDLHRTFLLERPSVVAGDFNTSTPLTEKRRGGGHADIVKRLDEEFGLVSAYHHFFGEEHSRESRPTHYWMWKEANPFHIDYCFVPRSWMGRVREVTVGGYQGWAEQSDHRPLVVDVGDESSANRSA